MEPLIQTRRIFLRDIALTTLAASTVPTLLAAKPVAPAPAAPVPAAAVATGVDSLDLAWFKSVVGHRFQLTHGNESLTLTLADVTEHKRTDPLENFSVQFAGANERSPGQGTYRFSHPETGAFDLFVVPNRTASGVHGYVAVFNRLV